MLLLLGETLNVREFNASSIFKTKSLKLKDKINHQT